MLVNSSIPALWPEDQVTEREDGFLILFSPQALDHESSAEQQEQPLLLHSTQVFLTELYPGRSLAEILALDPVPLSELEESCPPVATEDSLTKANEKDNQDNSDDENSIADQNEMQVEKEGQEPKKSKKSKKKKNPPPGLEYQNVYQTLKRRSNLGNRLPPMIADWQSFKHRPNKRPRDKPRESRDQAKIRALEKQQQQLLKQVSNSDDKLSAGEVDVDDCGNDTEDEDPMEVEEEEEGSLTNIREPGLVRIIRTINSIRAALPHLLQILNHKRRNDKQLKIGSAVWKDKRRGFCWILGSQVFDSTSSRMAMNMHTDCRLVLESFIDVERARSLVDDPRGGSHEFWSREWLSAVKSRAGPTLMDPISTLKSYTGDSDRHHALEAAMKKCDERLYIESLESDVGEIQEQYDQAVQNVHQEVSRLLKDRFRGARISIYGSCLSNLSLGKGADVDLSLWLPRAEKLQTDFEEGRVEANEYEKDMKQFVFQVFHRLKGHKHFDEMIPVTRARVPVVKGTFLAANNPYNENGSLSFDVCFLNDIAVANSGLIREYSLVDSRVRKLMMAVKLWAKENKINSAKDNTISSYAWVNLVIFYLQCIHFVPNLQCPALMKKVGFQPDPRGNIWHSVRKLDTWYLAWAQVQQSGVWSQPVEVADLPASALLYGFFEFYARRFPSAGFAVSIKEGAMRKRKIDSNKANLFFSIEDPFETYDSHCPHDLSVPAGEGGIRKMFHAFQSAEWHLRQLLLGNLQEEKLWPGESITDDITGGTTKKNANPHGKEGKKSSNKKIPEPKGKRNEERADDITIGTAKEKADSYGKEGMKTSNKKMPELKGKRNENSSSPPQTVEFESASGGRGGGRGKKRGGRGFDRRGRGGEGRGGRGGPGGRVAGQDAAKPSGDALTNSQAENQPMTSAHDGKKKDRGRQRNKAKKTFDKVEGGNPKEVEGTNAANKGNPSGTGNTNGGGRGNRRERRAKAFAKRQEKSHDQPQNTKTANQVS